MPCQFPEHHTSGGHSKTPIFVAIIVILLIVYRKAIEALIISAVVDIAIAIGCLIGLAGALYGLIRFAAWRLQTLNLRRLIGQFQQAQMEYQERRGIDAPPLRLDREPYWEGDEYVVPYPREDDK